MIERGANPRWENQPVILPAFAKRLFFLPLPLTMLPQDKDSASDKKKCHNMIDAETQLSELTLPPNTEPEILRAARQHLTTPD